MVAQGCHIFLFLGSKSNKMGAHVACAGWLNQNHTSHPQAVQTHDQYEATSS